ncbi:ferrous iron transport protein B [Maricaulis salignorans]|uniref:Ferrous iron transport protein B n=1 Tax=Maricaulis salignorans TaxID=144026 RepID=A0A1G9W9D5_9PROT|nr:ferrous iron transport protein B [Maricaulis salignorans]SDM80883.1 ferrous iron transport protein B [Maricaulis salignorans]
MSRLRIALVGAPNSGKSTLFNGLTGGRAKVANYSGVTVETRTGQLQTPGGAGIDLIDLPGIYGLKARSTDERIAIDLLCNGRDGEAPPDGMLVLIDAAHLRTHLHTVLQMRAIGRPMIVVLNMIDLAERDGLKIDVERLQTELGVPVVTSRATRATGRADLLACIDRETAGWQARSAADSTVCTIDTDLSAMQREARGIADKAILFEPVMNRLTRQIDQFVLHPVAGPIILAALLFFMFQAVYSWSGPFMDALEAGAAGLGQLAGQWLPAGWFHDLIVDGIIAGVGSVVVFLPQIVILFLFILALEASGYMARAAVLMDELMLRVGLNGRAFIPLLSSFACAIPGIMSARTIDNERDRLTTIMVAPLMTCSARLPVYTLIIGAFIPPDTVGVFNLQGIVMFGLYLTGVVSAVTVAFILKRTVTKGSNQVLIMELPTYKLPNPRDFLLSLWGHVSAFLKRAGTIILTTSIILWFLASYPASATSLRESYAGMIGSVLEKLLAPIGFNLEIAIALVPGMAAREVAVGALGTVYAIQGGEENVEGLAAALQGAWSLPTALAFLAWYVFAPQCFATLATARRETNSWAWTGFMFAYLMTLAYIAAGATFHIASWVGL